MLRFVLWVLLYCSSTLLWADNRWSAAWPLTDFSRSVVDLSEVISGGPGKDGIPAIDQPVFVDVKDAVLADNDPVISVEISGQAKAYPLAILIWHEIVNDQLGDVPIAVTYCPLCNTSIVFDRRLKHEGKRYLLDFGTTGNLRHSDLIMYDRQTESWWQQYGGDGIVGTFAGVLLKRIPARLESFATFKKRFENGRVLVPTQPTLRDYGKNPYVGYDTSPFPFLYRGIVPKGIAPMQRVVAVGSYAIDMALLSEKGTIVYQGMTWSWNRGQSSALDLREISAGRDVGNVVVQHKDDDVPYVVTFAFAFFAFEPKGKILSHSGEIVGVESKD